MGPESLQKVSEAMKEQKKAEILQKAMDQFGFDRQLNKLQEECAELITAISKYRENQTHGNYCNVVEESVDVDIVLTQLMDYSYSQGDIDIFEKRKLTRLNGMLEK